MIDHAFNIMMCGRVKMEAPVLHTGRLLVCES